MKATLKTNLKTNANYLDQFVLLPTSFDVTNQWLSDHLSALNSAASEFASEYERALVEQVVGWLRYADAYRKTTGMGIGADVDLALGWVSVGQGLHDMLHSSCASTKSRFERLNRSVIAFLISDVIEAEGYNCRSGEDEI